MDIQHIVTIIASILVPTMGGFAWLISRMDKRFQQMDTRFREIDIELKSQSERLARIEGAIWSNRHTGTGH